MLGVLPTLLLALATPPAIAQPEDLLAGHPRASYADVKEIDAMETALRESMAAHERHSFSRGWWGWDRLRCRYVDGGRKDANALKILRAVFRGLILDRHRRLEAKGEGDLLYLYYTTLKGDSKESVLNIGGRKVYRDLHGGGYHGGWGGAARMRIYLELADQNMLTTEEKERFRGIVHQSLESKFIDFKAKAQSANNHSFGNAGGVALALKHFPGAPQAAAARAWIDRIWAHLAGFGDWTEWTYYPYGPIFLHGMIDVAEATGRIESDRDLINAVGARCLGFVHGSGVRGNPNSGAQRRKDLSAIYADPWQVGYYDVETSVRDGHFWYRLAQHYKNPDYLWAAEQVTLGGRPPGGVVPAAYQSAYDRRFAWFAERNIVPRVPASRAMVGLLSATSKKIPERLYLTSGRQAGKPFAAFFLYERKDAHLDNVSGHLYEYSAGGAKFLHTSGKYNNVYTGNELRGGGTGEESLDLLLVLHQRHEFPVHPDRQGDKLDHLRRGSIVHLPDFAVAQNNDAGDSYGQFAFDHYYGEGSRWIRRAVLTAEGCLVVADQFTGGESLGRDYLAGPVWHLGVDENTATGHRERNWFDAPALDRAWWQTDAPRVVLYFHDDRKCKFGTLRQSHSQDVGPSVTTFASRPINAGRSEHFLSVFFPHPQAKSPREVASQIKTTVAKEGSFQAAVGSATVTIKTDGSWSVVRQ